MRLSPPTRRTFLVALVAIVGGVVLWFAPLDVTGATDVAFYLTAAGAVLLVLGTVFNRI